MQPDATSSICCFLLTLAIPLYQGIRNWRENKLRQQTADAHGWRYRNRGWNRMFASPSYEIAGTTAGGIVWELRRVRKKRQLYLLWRSQERLLPYGMLVIRPRHAKNGGNLPVSFRQVDAGSHRWQSEYVFWTTHNMLSVKYFNREVELAMADWPQWPAPGSLENIIWTRDQLSILVRQHNDWFALNQIVVLGTALVDNAVQQR